MKQQLLRFIPLLLSILVTGSAWAALSVNDTFIADGITYKVISTNPMEVQVGDGRNNTVSTISPGVVTIPATVTGSDGNFYTVTSIGDYSFYNVTGMTSVAIPSTVKSIIKNAFVGCTGLTTVHITDLAAWCNMYFDKDGVKLLIKNNRLNSFFNPLFYAQHLYVNGVEVTDLVIPDNVTSISDFAFAYYSTLQSVTMGSNVTSIGGDAFTGCTGLSSAVVFANTIESNAFSGCSGLTSLTLGSSVETLGANAFSGCSELTSLELGSSIKTLGVQAFSNCSSLASITIPSSTDSIGTGAFQGCVALNTIKVESGNNESMSLRLLWRPFTQVYLHARTNQPLSLQNQRSASRQN